MMGDFEWESSAIEYTCLLGIDTFLLGIDTYFLL